jgi:hypothetical protein
MMLRMCSPGCKLVELVGHNTFISLAFDIFRGVRLRVYHCRCRRASAVGTARRRYKGGRRINRLTSPIIAVVSPIIAVASPRIGG